MIISFAALMLAACTTDSMKEDSKGKVIDFRASTLTKASEITNANFESFVATALNSEGANHFANELFERNGAYYYSGTDYYWPANNSELNFYAWSPAADKLGGTLTITASEQSITGFTTNADISKQVDFISATASGNGNDNSLGVELNFKHNMSQVEIKSRSANPGYIYKIKGVRFGNILSTGDFDFKTGSWSNVDNMANYTVEYSARTIDELSTSLMKVNADNAMFIPQNLTPWDPENDPTNTAKGAYIAVYARITTATNKIIYPLEGDYDWIAVPLGNNHIDAWEPGLRYIYTLDWSTGGGYVYPEKPAYGNDYTGYDIFEAGDRIMSTPIVMGLSVYSWNNQYPNELDM